MMINAKATKPAEMIFSIVLITLTLVLNNAAGEDLTRKGGDHYETGEITPATPHVKWAAPWSGGRLRALVLVSGIPLGGKPTSSYTKPGFAERDAVELAQRFDMSLDTVIMCDAKSGLPVPGKAASERLNALLRDNRYDVMALGNVEYESLDDEVKFGILSQMAKGTGLVCVGFPAKKLFIKKKSVGTPEFLTTGIGISGTRFPTKNKGTNSKYPLSSLISAFKLGPARALWIHYPVNPLALTPYLPYSKRNMALYEYWSAWVGRCFLWAGKKEPKCSLREIRGKKVVLSGISSGVNPTIFVSYKNKIGLSLKTAEFANPKRRADGSFEIPLRLPVNSEPGVVSAEIIAKIAGKSVAFGCFELEVPSIRGLKVEIDKKVVAAGETATVAIEHPAVRGGAVLVELYSLQRGVVFRKRFSAESLRDVANKLKVGIKISPEMFATANGIVKVSLKRGDAVLAAKELAICFPKRRQSGFKFVMWGERDDVLSYYGFKRLAEMGAKATITWRHYPVSSVGISQVAYLMKITPPRKRGKNNYYPFSWADDKTIDSVLKSKMSDWVWREAAARGVTAWSLGDEPATSSVDSSEAYLTSFRKFLKLRYGTIGELNSAWQSGFHSFDDIPAPNSGDVKKSAVVKAKSTARWYDGYFFSRHVFTNIFKRFKPIARSFDTKAKVGFEGAGELDKNPDIEGLTDINDFWVTYNDPAFDVIRGLTGKDFICSKWMGYNKSAASLIGYSWDTVFRGADSVWWWRFDGIGKYNGLIQSNLAFYPAALKMMKSLKPLTKGWLGEWLSACDRADDGVRILYSNASAAVSSGLFPKKGSYSGAHKGCVALLRSLGVGFRYTTEKRVENGALAKGNVKTLILPKNYVMSDACAAECRKFVDAGGVIVADVVPGALDGYCLKRTKPIFAGKFRSGGSATGNYVLVGKLFDNYPRIANATAGETTRREFRAILSNAGCRPRLSVNCENRGSVIPAAWNGGGADVFGVLNTSSEKVDAVLKWCSNASTRGLLNSDFNGETKILRVSIPPHEPVFVARSADFGKPEGSVPGKMSPGKMMAASFSELPKNVVQVLRVRLKSPDGEIVPYSIKTIAIRNGAAEYRWIPSFDDPRGVWTLECLQPATGSTKKWEIRLDVIRE